MHIRLDHGFSKFASPSTAQTPTLVSREEALLEVHMDGLVIYSGPFLIPNSWTSFSSVQNIRPLHLNIETCFFPEHDAFCVEDTVVT